MTLLNSFPHRCSIQRKVQVAGELGGTLSTPVNEQTNILCWDQKASDAEIILYAKRGMNITHKIYFLDDPGVTERNQILITFIHGATVTDPVVLEVKTKPEPDASAGLGVVWKVMADIKTGKDD